MTTTINTDLLTPLGAYLRLRGMGRRASCSSRSSAGASDATRGWAPARGSSRSRRRKRSISPSSAISRYDHVAPARADGAAARRRARLPGEPARRRRDARPLRSRRGHRRRVSPATPDEIAGRLEGGIPWHRETRGVAGELRRFPERERYEGMVRALPGAHRRRATRSRSCRRSAPSGRRPRRRSTSTARSAASTPRRTSSCSSWTGSRSSAPRPSASSRARTVAPASCPIAGTTEPTEGDVERLLSSEKDRAEHVMLVDLGRNDLSRVCRAGTVHVARSMEVERFSHVSHLVSEVVGELRDGVDAVRRAARLLPGRDGLRRAEGARDADHLRARGIPPRAVRRRGRSTRSPAARWTRASRCARS